ncbi:MAG: UPF0175 family protein [Turicibacter sp.]|nr:UPF0175 family protein [Turicibacter sp.]
MTSTIELQVRTGIVPYVQKPDAELEIAQQALIMYPYIKNETMSHGYVANLLGISKLELIEIYGNYGIPYLDMNEDEFEKEEQAVKSMLGEIG